MSNALANVYSFGNKLRNNLRRIIDDPANEIASHVNMMAENMNQQLDAPATAYRRWGGVMADDPSTIAAANREQERMIAALTGGAPRFIGMTAGKIAGQSGKIDSRLLAALGLGSAAAVAGNSLLNSGKKKMEDAKKARQQAIEKAEEK